MRLKNLQIKGFKSFADDTQVIFNEPIIGIVGPNGSGKSNIVDSIRWVLGEQKSSDLRLDKMTDVIFNGTKKRKSAGLAQVTLTFENTKNIIPIEFDEVAVTRILYATGDSEYRINNVKCRLKDIRDLFLDSGIGSNSYAIIELKMVDAILEDKDRARLRMFEQAAGVSKFKARKHETLNKLKNTEADLDRVEDILFELEASLKELRKQAERTRKFNELKEKYKDQSLFLAYSEKKTFETKQIKLEERIASETAKYQKAIVEKGNLQAEVENIKRLNLEQEKTLSTSQQKFNELIENTRNKESEKQILSQRIELNNKTIEQNQAKIEGIHREVKTLADEIKVLDGMHTKAKVEFDQLGENTEQIEAQYNKVLKEREEAKDLMSGAQDDLMNNQKKIYDFEKSIALLENEITSIGANSTNYIAQLDQIHQATKEDKTEIKNTEKLVAKLDADIIKLNTDITSFENQINTQENDKSILDKEIQDVNRKIDAKENELGLLKNMIDNMEGFPASIKFISDHWKKKIPLVQDVIDVEEDYKTGVEQFLEPYLNFFVAKDYKEAYTSVELLKDAQKGKSQFFVLSELENKQASANVMTGVRPAVEVLIYDKKYEALVSHLFRDVYLANENTSIESLKVPEGISVISSNGSMIKSKGMIRGGSIGIFEGKKLGRIKNVEKLEKLIEKLIVQRDKLEQKIRDINPEKLQAKLQQFKSERQTARLELNQEKIALAQRNTAISGFEAQIVGIEQKINTGNAIVTEKKAELAQTVKHLAELKASITENEGKEMDSSALFSNINKVYDDVNRVYNEHQINLIRLKSSLENLTNELQIKNELERSQDQRLKSYTDENLKLEAANKENKERAQVLLEALETLYLNKKSEQEALGLKEQDYFSEKNRILEEEEKLKKVDNILQESQIKINETKSKLQNISFTNQAIHERLKIEFNIEWENVDTSPFVDREEVNLPEYRVNTGRMRNRLENFGEINPLALNAYDEMKLRYDNTVTQRDDINKAKESLLDTIAEIETTATEQFHKAFDQIRENFKEVFRSLFTDDDDCDLVLLNPDKPLESEIEIIAKPKGKKPKVLKQLSGGEKTLTATALLFSLYLLKPAPFCIFDEVDAPLDDINTEKFNKLIKRFSEHSQFIIITHNKATMAAVNILYGIFLKEDGVSGLAPVDFRELEYV